MSVLQFIHANFWTLLAMCGVVGALGITLWIIGTLIRREGERRMLFAQEYRHREMMAMQRGREPGLEPDCFYPPVQEYEYWDDEG